MRIYVCLPPDGRVCHLPLEALTTRCQPMATIEDCKAEDKGCGETGALLGISERTVKSHLQNIYRKLNVVNRAQAITKAMRYSLI